MMIAIRQSHENFGDVTSPDDNLYTTRLTGPFRCSPAITARARATGVAYDIPPISKYNPFPLSDRLTTPERGPEILSSPSPRSTDFNAPSGIENFPTPSINTSRHPLSMSIRPQSSNPARGFIVSTKTAIRPSLSQYPLLFPSDNSTYYRVVSR